jgi:hypothetical protein
MIYTYGKFERVQACNGKDKLAKKQRTCDNKFAGKMFWHRVCIQYFVVKRLCVCLSLDYSMFVCEYSFLFLALTPSSNLCEFFSFYCSVTI